MGEKMIEFDKGLTLNQKRRALEKKALDFFLIPKSERKEAKKYHFIKQGISNALSKEFKGIPKPEIKRGSSNASINAKNARGTYKINGYSIERTDFINYPKSCFNDQLKLNFLEKQLSRGKITQTVFEDLKSVLYIPEKPIIISATQIRKEKNEEAKELIHNIILGKN